MDKLWNLPVGTIAKTDGERIIKYLDTNTLNTLLKFIKSRDEANKKKWQAEAQIEVIDYIFRRPTGELTMSVADMKETLDEDWRDETIQYFFNVESLMMNLDRQKEKLTKDMRNG